MHPQASAGCPWRHIKPKAAPANTIVSSVRFWLGTYRVTAAKRNKLPRESAVAIILSSRFSTADLIARITPAITKNRGISHANTPKIPTVPSAVVIVENPTLKSKFQNRL
jgi:hypothetical protein